MNAKCQECQTRTTQPNLVSNFAGGPRNSTEMIVCSGCVPAVTERAVFALNVAAIVNGPFVTVLRDNDHFVKIAPVAVKDC
jgi:hypothetical protein